MLEKYWGFEEIESTVDAFERVLRRVGIRIDGGSQLEHGCLVLQDLHSRHVELKRYGRFRPWPTMHLDLPLAAGILNLAALTVDMQAHPDFHAVVPHLALLNQGMPAQTVRSRATDDASNKVFELRLALACLRTGSGLSMDEPDGSSGGANPDILCRMGDGRTWGFACKVVHGQSPLTVFERLSDAVDQIERSVADIGLPVLSFKNRLPYDKLMPVKLASGGTTPAIGAHASEQIPIDIAARAVGQWIREVQVAATDPELDRLFRGKKTITGVAVPIDFIALVTEREAPVLALIDFLRVVELNFLGLPRSFDERATAVAVDINVGLARRGEA